MHRRHDVYRQRTLVCRVLAGSTRVLPEGTEGNGAPVLEHPVFVRCKGHRNGLAARRLLVAGQNGSPQGRKAFCILNGADAGEFGHPCRGLGCCNHIVEPPAHTGRERPKGTVGWGAALAAP